MKVLFLDIDGVLCTARSHHAYSSGNLWQYLDPVACRLIFKILQSTGAKIVISSDWRHFHDKCSMESILMNAGFEIVSFHEDWLTPSKLSASRGQEIGIYLRDHPEIKKYAIVDDNADMLTEQKPFFVQTDVVNGLTFQNYQDLMALLA